MSTNGMATKKLTKEDVAASIHAMILEGRGRKRKDGTSADDADRLGIHAALLKHKDQGERGHGFIQFASGEKIRLSPGERDAALHKINNVVYSGAHRSRVHDFIKRMDSSKDGFHQAMSESFNESVEPLETDA